MSSLTKLAIQSKFKSIITLLPCCYDKLFNPIKISSLNLIKKFKYQSICQPKYIINYNIRKLSNTPDNGDQNKKPKRPLFLMEFDERIWPHPFKTIKNIFFSYLIKRSIDRDFDAEEFMKGSQMAMCTVSENISKGNFDQLEHLVSRDAIHEIKQNYEELNDEQREFIRIDPEDIFLKFIYEIGMIFDDSSSKLFYYIY